MTYREELHSKECQANRLITAIQNLRDNETASAFDFRLAAQSNDFLTEADTLLDPEEVGRDTFLEFCICEVKAQYLVEMDLGGQEVETLGSCGCVDYHMADCPLRTSGADAISAAEDRDDPDRHYEDDRGRYYRNLDEHYDD